VRGKYVLVSMPQRSCRPDSALRQWATPETFTSMVRQRTEDTQAWNARVAMTGTPAETTFALANRALARKLEAAGARGVITSLWSLGWGVNKIFNARVDRVPVVDLSCEDYGLVYRLAANGQAPVLRVQAESQDLGEVPVFNTIAEIKGSEKPNEYVMLSAHFDSWDGASGATDNGTGTVVMLEAMRILRKVYPSPKRTILVGHWSGEEQGLNGSRAFAADHPEIVRGLQALFNQDNGTGRIVNVSPAGLVDASANLARWAARLPAEIARHINFSFPGAPAGGGSDNAAFICYGAPGFGLGSLNFDYGQYTWHTNRDTFDKIVFDDLKNNATLVATLVYLASEDPETVPRERRIFTPNSQTGLTATWPSCVEAQRSSTTYMR
jgi:carboxypeptidase Q